MSSAPPVRTFDLDQLSTQEGYKLLVGTIVPRPIAWVTTVDQEGRVNAAPFSFFNCLSSNPPLVAIGIGTRGDPALTQKDTTRNIRLTGEFTVNIVSHGLAEAMNICGTAFEAGVEELNEAGLHVAPGLKVKTPRIAEAPAALECRRHTVIQVGPGNEIVLGLVLAVHVQEGIVDERLHVDPAKLDAVGRMGGAGYATTRDYFELDRLTPEEHAAGKVARRRAERRP